MDTISESRMEVGRFASYVEELRDFARSYRMHVGSSEDLDALRKALDAPGPFREECASMIRSFVYRERGNANHEDLLSLVIAAWGGPEVDSGTEPLQESIKAITIFLAGVMRVQRGGRPSLSSTVSTDKFQDPVVSEEHILQRPTGIYAAAAQTAEREQGLEGHVEPAGADVEVHDGLDSTLKELEAQSPDVQLYLQLLKQRTVKLTEEPASDLVVLNERSANPPLLAPAVLSQREDPWDENSELRKELRHFAAEREARDAEHRAAKAARAPYIKVLFVVEKLLYRLVGSDNMVRRYLSRHLQPPARNVEL